jgi:YbbR domain-containing protein
MAQREIIEKVASYIAGSSATTEEDFYELQSLLSDGAVKSVSRNEPIQGATKDTPKKLSSEYDSDQIASFFSTELSQCSRQNVEITSLIEMMEPICRRG